MATLTAANPRLCKNPNNTAPVEVLVKNGETWNPGQFLRIDTSGLLVAAVTDQVAGNGGFQYQAITKQTDPGNSTTRVAVLPLDEDMVFEGNELDGSVGSDNIGQQYAISVASNVVTVDEGDTSNPAVVIVAPGSDGSPNNIDSDTKARLYFKVLGTVINAARAA